MNNYNCEIVADSLNTFGNRIITFKLTYPRIVHAELMTHRMFSRNAASSRAVPVRKMIESVKNNMFTPLAIQKAHRGMQGSDYFEGKELEQATQLWIESAELALQQAEKMEKFGITKQIINRILEPYQYYQVLVTATEWENFFKLRCPQYDWGINAKDCYHRSKKDQIKDVSAPSNKDELKNLDDVDWLKINKSQAEIHIQAIAELMWDAMNESTPKQLQAGQWHLPFSDKIDEAQLAQTISPNKALIYSNTNLEELKLKVCVSRCARISYETLGDNPKIDYAADIKLHDILASNGHASPFEHVAKCMDEIEYYRGIRCNIIDGKPSSGWCKNFRGFIQYREFLENGEGK